MNRTKRSQPKQLIKAMRKEVRRAQVKQPAPSIAKTSPLTAKLETKKAPVKGAEKRTTAMTSLQNKLKTKKVKTTTKISKRTTPGLITDSVPQIVHMEAGRWMKTTVKQSVSRGKTLSKRLSKR